MSRLWLNYDRAGLDAQYNLRAAVADHQTYFDGWIERSHKARAALPCRLDVPYGPGPLERLDLFPAAEAGAPVHAFIHGGYWHRMDKSDFSFIAEGLVPAGIATAIVNYPLAPAASMDQIVQAVRMALAWLWYNAPRFGGDRNRIFVTGHSAGGQLIAMALLTKWRRIAPDLPKDLVKGACAISGIYELEPIRLSYLNEMVRLDAESARRNSPLGLVAAGHWPKTKVPVVFSLGDNETAEFHRQQARFVAAWLTAGMPGEIILAPGLHHFSVVEELARADSPLNQAVVRQMGR